jgi:hypothetical protein
MPRTANAPIQINIPPGAVTNLLVSVVVFGMVTTAVVLGTALYGSEEKSERAYRLLDRIQGRPLDPEKPEPSPTPRSRTRPTARGESVRAATLRP